jgi:hypothetical protein
MKIASAVADLFGKNENSGNQKATAETAMACREPVAPERTGDSPSTHLL